jgi:hypothetical protein
VPEDSQKLRAERASAYLEKLCQHVWRLPAVRDPKGYLLSLLGYSNEAGLTEVWVRWGLSGGAANRVARLRYWG